MPHIGTEGTGGTAVRRDAAARQPTASGDRSADGGDDLGEALGDRVGLLLGRRLDHHPDELLGAGRAQQHPAGVAELRLDGVDRLGDLVARGDGAAGRRPAR